MNGIFFEVNCENDLEGEKLCSECGMVVDVSDPHQCHFKEKEKVSAE